MSRGGAQYCDWQVFRIPWNMGRVVHQSKGRKVRAGCYPQKEDERDGQSNRNPDKYVFASYMENYSLSQAS